MVRVTGAALVLLALSNCLLLTCCRSAGLVVSPEAPDGSTTPAAFTGETEPASHARMLRPADDLRASIAAPRRVQAPAGRFQRVSERRWRWAAAERGAAWKRPMAPPPSGRGVDGVDSASGPSQADTQIGRGFTVPSSSYRGIAGTQLRGNIAFLAPDVFIVGFFYRINSRWTVGVVGQRLVQKRSVSIDGQLVDPTDLNSFISAFTIAEQTTSIAFGPFVQFQILPERGRWPALSVAAYSLEWGQLTSASTQNSAPGLIVTTEMDGTPIPAASGDSADKYRTVFFSASKRLSFVRASGFVHGVRAYGGAGYGVRTGKRYAVAETGQGDPRIRVRRKELTRHSFVGWLGAEAQLPRRFSLYGEVFTGDECATGYAGGLRWMSPLGISFTLGVSNCFESIPQRALDLVYLPGGIGGQPSVVSSGGGLDGGGLGYLSSFDDDDDDRRPRRRSARPRAPAPRRPAP